MIQANELRIGNLVQVKYPEGSIGEDSPIYDTVKGIMFPSKVLTDKDAHWSHISDLQPIPLTPEILEKFGFEEDGKLYVIDKDRYHTFSILQGETCQPFIKANHHEISEHFSLYGIKYLHQLQNLYFALTGQELEYKP